MAGIKSIRRKALIILMCSVCIAITFNACSKRKKIAPTQQMSLPKNLWVRVLLKSNCKQVYINAESNIDIYDSSQQKIIHNLPPAKKPYTLEIKQGIFSIDDTNLPGTTLTFEPAPPTVFALNSKKYRGNIVVNAAEDGKSFNAINHLPIEPYLYGVIGEEMPSYWEPAALQAQAIAARTYALYIKRKFGEQKDYDLAATQASQVYNGIAAENAQVKKAVDATAGQVLLYQDENGQSDIFCAYYSSVCGGHTENSKNVFGGDTFAPLTGVNCPYCKYATKPGFFFWPMVQIPKKTVTKKLLENYKTLEKLKSIKQIIPIKQSEYSFEGKDFSRITFIKLIGENDTFEYLYAEDFRLTIDPTGSKLRSTSFNIIDANDSWQFTHGRGYGHCVGLCQCGAQALARLENKTAHQILQFYYPTSTIGNIYD